MTAQSSKLLKYLIGLILLALPTYLIRFSVAGIPSTALEVGIYFIFIFYFGLFILGRARFYFQGCEYPDAPSSGLRQPGKDGRPDPETPTLHGRGGRHLPHRRWVWLVGLFVLGALVGVMVSPEKRVALGQFKGFIFDPLLLGFVLYSAIRSNIISFRWVIGSLILGGLLVSVGDWFFSSDQAGRSLSFFSLDPTASPNFLALLLGPIFVLTVPYLKSRLRILRQTQSATLWDGLVYAGFFLIPYTLFSAQSRGVVLGVALAVGYLIYHRSTRPMVKQATVVVEIIFLIVAAFLARPDLSASPDAGRIASSNNIRYEIWKTTAEILTTSPRNFFLGVGLGNYQPYFTKLTKDRVNYPEFISPKALTPHNLFLAFWVNGGLVMLVAGSWLLFELLRRPTFLPAQAALLAIIGHGLVDTPYFKNDLSVLFWTLVVLVMIGFERSRNG